MRHEPYFADSLDFLVELFKKDNPLKLVVAKDHIVYEGRLVKGAMAKGTSGSLVNVLESIGARVPFIRLEVEYADKVVSYDFSKEGRKGLAPYDPVPVEGYFFLPLEKK